MAQRIKPGQPCIVYFREVLEGDVRKLKAESNDAATGGGARDLRIRPADRFNEVMLRMFRRQGSQEGVRLEYVHWEDYDGQIRSCEVEYWRPTSVRPNEARIARINELDFWRIDEQAYSADKRQGFKWFFLLVLDDEKRLWGRLVKATAIPQMSQAVREFFVQRISDCISSGQTISGAIDLDSGEEYP